MSRHGAIRSPARAAGGRGCTKPRFSMAALQGCFLLQLCAPQLSVGHGGTGQGVPAGSLSLLCVLAKGLHLQVTLKVVWPELLKPLVWYFAAARTLLGQRDNESIKHQIQVYCSPTTFSLLPSGQRFSVLPPTSFLFCNRLT